MSDLFWLSRSQLQRIEPYFTLAHGVPRVDDQRVISGIIHVIRNGLRWRDAPKEYGPRKTRSCTHRMAANLCCINHPTRRQTETSSHSSDSTAKPAVTSGISLLVWTPLNSRVLSTVGLLTSTSIDGLGNSNLSPYTSMERAPAHQTGALLKWQKADPRAYRHYFRHGLPLVLHRQETP